MSVWSNGLLIHHRDKSMNHEEAKEIVEQAVDALPSHHRDAFGEFNAAVDIAISTNDAIAAAAFVRRSAEDDFEQNELDNRIDETKDAIWKDVSRP
jgi:hypothetical protein